MRNRPLNHIARRKQNRAHQFEVIESRRMLAAVPFSEENVIDDLDADGAWAIATADLDGDMDNDVIVGSYFDGRVSWYENLGEDKFAQHLLSTDSNDVHSVIAVDLDGDGDNDIASTSYSSDRVEWFENTDGKGTFIGRTLTTSARGAHAVTSGDLDNDGDVDLISISSLDDKLAWYENQGNGQFSALKLISTSTANPRAVRAADINGDDSLDLIVASRRDDAVTWFQGDGNGGFGGPRALPTDLEQPESIEVGDLDGDGDADVVVAAYGSREIVWHENLGGGSFSPEIQLSGGNLRGLSVEIADLDGDGDQDIVAGSYFNYDSLDDKVAWFENTDGNGTFGSEQFISFNNTVGVKTVHAADLDEDGDLDVLSASIIDDKLVWYENDGAARFRTGQKSILSDAGGAVGIDFADVNGDGTTDVLAAAYWDNGLSWYENDSKGQFGTEVGITNSAMRVQAVRAGDIDGDGDIDALSASFRDDKIAWYANDGTGAFGEPMEINSRANGATDVNVADIDNDGDLDVLSASVIDATVAWYENLDGKGTFGPINTLTQRSFGAEWVDTADIDGDGDLDVISAAYGNIDNTIDGRVSWFENTDGQGTFSSAKLIHVGDEQVDTVVAIDIDGDGDLDLASTFYRTGELGWFENTDGLGEFSDVEIIAGGLSRVEALHVADIDGNGTDDLLTASTSVLVWIERDEGRFLLHEISGGLDGIRAVHAVDIDEDGDLDVAAAAVYSSEILWFENLSASEVSGDFNNDGQLDIADVDLICQAIQAGDADSQFDLTNDGSVDISDLDDMIINRLNSTYGDANLDGVFNSRDLVTVFTAGEYEDGVAGNSTWSEGDWNCDGEFNTRDLVQAFTQGDYNDTAIKKSPESSIDRTFLWIDHDDPRMSR